MFSFTGNHYVPLWHLVLHHVPNTIAIYVKEPCRDFKGEYCWLKQSSELSWSVSISMFMNLASLLGVDNSCNSSMANK